MVRFVHALFVEYVAIEGIKDMRIALHDYQGHVTAINERDLANYADYDAVIAMADLELLEAYGFYNIVDFCEMRELLYAQYPSFSLKGFTLVDQYEEAKVFMKEQQIGLDDLYATMQIKGHTFCLTGRLYIKRSEAIAFIEEHGGRIVPRGDNADYLLVGSLRHESRKLKQCGEKTIIIDKDRFHAFYLNTLLNEKKDA